MAMANQADGSGPEPAVMDNTVVLPTEGQEKELENDVQQAQDVVAAEEKVEGEYIYGLKLGIVLIGIIVIAVLVLLDLSIIATATPKITSEFRSIADVGWYGSAYLLTSATLQPMSGKIYQRFNVKYTYLAFFGIFELGSLICGVSQSSNMFIVGRAVAGIGSSGVGNGALTILSASIPLEKRALYFGIVGSCGQIGVVLSPLIGGALTQYASWRWCFYINLPAGVIAVAALFFIPLPEHGLQKPDPKPLTFRSLFNDLDIAGFLLFSPTMIMFLLALEWGGSTYAWDSATVIGLFCGSAGTFALFLIWEYRKGDSAMIPFAMVRTRVLYCASLTSFFLYANSLVTSYYLAIYFQGVRGVSPTSSGVHMLPGIIGQMITGTLSGFIVTRLGYYMPSVLLGTTLAAIGSGLISTFTPSTSTGEWIGYQIIAGVGRGCALQMPLIAVQNYLHPSKIAVSIAFVYFCQNFGGTLWLSFAETAFGTGLKNNLPIYAPDVSYDEVVAAGVSGIRSGISIPRDAVAGVVLAYDVSVQHVFYMVAATAASAFVVSWGLGWRRIKKRSETSKA